MSLSKYFKFTQPRPNPKFPRRTYYAMAPNDIFQVALVDMTGKGKEVPSTVKSAVKQQAGKGSGEYILNVIDVYSRKAESITLSNKDGNSILNGLKEIFKRMGQPKKIQADQEKGLWAKEKELKNMGIDLYKVGNAYDGKFSAPIVERLNRTMNDYMYKTQVDHPELSNKGISNFVANNFPKQYNKNKHSTIKTTPNSAFNGTTSTSDVLGAVFHKSELNKKPTRQAVINKSLKVGDTVYIPTEAPARGNIEAKGADRWDRTPYKIEKIFNTNPSTYLVNGKKFYIEQLRKAT